MLPAIESGHHKIFAGVKENIKFVNEFHFVTFMAHCTTISYSNICFWKGKTSANKYVQHLCVQNYAELSTLGKYLHLVLKIRRGETIQFISLCVVPKCP